MEKIKEVIVVEGIHDTSALQQYFECDTIETGGKSIDEQAIQRIIEVKKTRDVIVFTDPDNPGEYIRRVINERVPGCKQAFIEKKKARTDKKVGIEHASKEDLWNALSHCVTITNVEESISWTEFIDLGLVGNKKKREKVCSLFFVGPCNAKTCFKRLNQMNISKKDIEDRLYESKNCDN